MSPPTLGAIYKGKGGRVIRILTPYILHDGHECALVELVIARGGGRRWLIQYETMRRSFWEVPEDTITEDHLLTRLGVAGMISESPPVKDADVRVQTPIRRDNTGFGPAARKKWLAAKNRGKS